MHKRLRRYGFSLMAVGAVMICFLAISAAPALFAGNVPVNPDEINPEMDIITGIFKIEWKGTNYIIIKERHFIITKETVIWDLYGQITDLSKLPIPCEAEIKCRLIPNQNDALCLEIKVKKRL
jgi:hypothetical protein